MTQDPHPFSAKEMSTRLANIRAAMSASNLDAIITTDASNVRYTTGFRGEPRTLLITADELILFTSFRTLPWAQEQTKNITSNIQLNTSPTALTDIAKKLTSKPLKIGIDRYVSQHTFLTWQSTFPTHQLQPVSIIEQVRQFKSPAEISLMQHSQVINETIFNNVISQIKPGMTERSVQGLILTEMAANTEVDGYSFNPIVAVGPNAWEIHHLPDHTVIKENDMILIDHGVFYQGYASDMTRTVCLGTATDEMHTIYNTVGTAQKAAINAIKPGTTTFAIDQAARQIITTAGHARCFTHGLGHSIGLETHDPGPNFNQNDNGDTLAPGMAFTVEPGIYLENGFGVRTEDVIIVTETGHTNLTAQSHQLIELSL
ncbi:MAG: M24 family metallopeptidase [Akkermansiaceae bacterium]